MQLPVSPLLDPFLQSLRLDRGASDHTLEAYRSDLKRWLAHLEISPIDSPEKLEHALQDQDFDSLLAQWHSQGIQASTLSRRISAFRSFLRFWVNERGWTLDALDRLPLPKKQQKLPKTLTPEEVQALLGFAGSPGLPYKHGGDALRARDHAMLLTLYATGLRVSELVGLMLADVDLKLPAVRVLGKGSKERLVPLPRPIAEHLVLYIQQQRGVLKPLTEHLFVSAQGTALTRQAFWQTLKKLAAGAGVTSPLSPHVVRHAFASHLLANGMSLRSLQMLLGHSSVATTQIYTHLAPEHLQEAIERFHPRGAKQN